MGRKHIAAMIGLVSGLTILGGCASTSESGPAIDHARLDSLVKGKSTKADAQTGLGMPNGSQTLPNGSSQLVYTHSITASTNYGPIPIPGKAAFRVQRDCQQSLDPMNMCLPLINRERIPG